ARPAMVRPEKAQETYPLWPARRRKGPVTVNFSGTSPRAILTTACPRGNLCPKTSGGKSSTIFESLAPPNRALRVYVFRPTKRLPSASIRPRQKLRLPTTVLRSQARFARSRLAIYRLRSQRHRLAIVLNL